MSINKKQARRKESLKEPEITNKKNHSSNQSQREVAECVRIRPFLRPSWL
jgi:hypothetical protein